MARKKSKKIVFVIVEGPSDSTALELFLDRIYDDKKVHMEIIHGDITSQYGVSSSNIINKINDYITRYKINYHVDFDDFEEIIHIVDMDGSYINDDAIIYDNDCDKLFYSSSCIKTNDVQSTKERNKRKRECIDRISSLPSIHNIKYQVYYMSCNLDHVLFNKLNISDKEKEESVFNFVKQYKENIPGFITFICDSDFLLIKIILILGII